METEEFVTQSGTLELYNDTAYATGELLAVLDRVEATVPAWSRRGDGRPRLAVRPRRPWSPVERVVVQVRYGDEGQVGRGGPWPYRREPDPMFGYVERPDPCRQVMTLVRVVRPCRLPENPMALLFGNVPGAAPTAFVLALAKRFTMLFHAWQRHDHLPEDVYPRPKVDVAGLHVRVPLLGAPVRHVAA